MTQARKLTALIGWSKTQGATIPSHHQRRPRRSASLPMAMCHLGDQPLAERAASMQSSHVRLGPGLVDKDQPLGINFALQPLPLLAASRHVMAILLAGVQCFFIAEAGAIEEMPHTVVADLDLALAQFGQQLASGNIRLGRQPGADPVALRGQP